MRSFFIVIFILCGLNTCQVPNKTSSKTTAPCGVELYYFLGGLGPELREEFNARSFNRIVFVNQRNIDGRAGWKVDRALLTTYVNKQIPNVKDNVVVTLDWEGDVLETIKRGPEDKDFDRAVKLFIEAYQLVKELRPQTKVGYYGLPIRNYWKRDDSWRDKNRGLDELLSNFDILFPSIYDFYASNSTNGKGDRAYVADNVAEALAMGSRIGKPVMPYIWHRYHPSNKAMENGFIPIPEFREHVDNILATIVDGKRVDGLVWWSSEYSRFAGKNKNNFTDKKLMRRAWEKESLRTLPAYFNEMYSAAEEICKE